MKTKEKQTTFQNTFHSNIYFLNFTEMPLLLKVIFVFNVLSLVTTFVNFIQIKPIVFEYFNSGFPKDFPVIWYLYLLVLHLAAVSIYIKRSFSLLKKYLSVVFIIYFLGFLNSAYLVINLPNEQKIGMSLINLLIYLFLGFILVYQLKQTKYFNQA